MDTINKAKNKVGANQHTYVYIEYIKKQKVTINDKRYKRTTMLTERTNDQLKLHKTLGKFKYYKYL